MNIKPAFPWEWRTRQFSALLLTVQAAAVFLFLGAIPGASAIVAALPADTAFVHFYPVPMIANDGVPGGGEDDETLQTVETLGAMLENGDVDGLMALAVAQPLDCTPMEGSWPLCEGESQDAEVLGFRVAVHGSHGEKHDEDGLRTKFEEAVARGAELASYGCAVDLPGCEGLIVIFESDPDKMPRVFYIVVQDGPIVGAGLAGDNAADLLREGEANAWFGATQIYLVP